MCKMESTSIVSFTNDATLQNNTLKPDYNNVGVHELALHAMRDRCLLLQRRVNALETDNMRLKLESTKTIQKSPYVPLQEDEKFQLQQRIAELNKQKSQLLHHVFMVSCENKNLWNKIASLRNPNKIYKQALARANTFVQSTPKESANYEENYADTSLEEISLKLINSYIDEKSQLVDQYEQMARLCDDELLNVDSIGFLYVDDSATDSLKEIYNHTIKLQDLKKELSQQHQDLKAVTKWVENVLKEGYKCPSCISKNSKPITSEHKEIGTSESLVNFATPVDSSNYNETTTDTQFMDLANNGKENQVPLQDDTEKVCPMCGETYPGSTEFSKFQDHVVSHFVGEMEPDSITDNLDNFPN